MNISDYDKIFNQKEKYYTVPGHPKYKYTVRNNKFMYKSWEFERFETFLKFIRMSDEKGERFVEEKFIRNVLFKYFKMNSPTMLKYQNLNKVMEDIYHEYKGDIICLYNANKEAALELFSSCVYLNLV